MKEICQDRSKRAKELKSEGEKIIGYFCCFPPLEFMTALDLVPYRIFGDPKEPQTRADRYMDPISCGYVRSCFDIADKGRYEFLDGLVPCRACQGIEIGSETWRYFFEPAYYFSLDIPHKMSPWGLEFFRGEIEAFKKDLERYANSEVSDLKLRETIELHNENRALVRELYSLRKPDPPLISGTEIMQVMVATMSIPAGESNQLLKEVLKEVKERQDHPEKKPARLLIWGTIIDDTPLIGLMEESGANVVMDDICVGSRFYWHDVELTEDPLDGLAVRYLDKIVCPRTAREHPGSYKADMENRFHYLREYAKDFNCNGAILQVTMYCDTHGWEVPAVKGYLEEGGLPTLYIEHDYSAIGLEPLKTRIQAFVEMIQ